VSRCRAGTLADGARVPVSAGRSKGANVPEQARRFRGQRVRVALPGMRRLSASRQVDLRD